MKTKKETHWPDKDSCIFELHFEAFEEIFLSSNKKTWNFLCDYDSICYATRFIAQDWEQLLK